MSKFPLIDTSVQEADFVYPVGLAVGEPRQVQPLPLPPGNSLGYHVAPQSGQQRSRGLSNATMATADVRLTMRRSITDMFSSIGEAHSGQHPRSRHVAISALELPRVLHLFEQMRLRGDDGDVIIYTPEFSGGTRKRIFRRPIPLSHISSDIDLDDCSQEVMHLWGLFIPVVTRACDELTALTFAAGKPTTEIQRVASSVLAKVANDKKLPHFQENYRIVTNGKVCRWLMDKPDNWDFAAGTINNHGFSSILFKETTNTMFQQRDEVIVDFREGVKIVVQTEPLLAGDLASEVERVYPPGSRSPSAHAKQARRILALVCNVRNPEELRITDLTPSPYFLVSKAVERMIAAAIYSPGLTSFALMVERWLDNSVDPNAEPGAAPKTVYPGPRWMPLHVISFSATFIIIELVRLAALEKMGGLDIKKASSIHSMSTFEGFISAAVTDTVQLYYDNPKSEAGRIIHHFLTYLEGDWKLEDVARQYWSNLDDLEHILPKGAQTY